MDDSINFKSLCEDLGMTKRTAKFLDVAARRDHKRYATRNMWENAYLYFMEIDSPLAQLENELSNAYNLPD
jgi:hypothetical protein